MFIKKSNMKVIVLLVSILTLSQISVFCQQSSRRVSDTIRYEFVEGKIIIPVIVNGLKVKYIVDTGGKTGTMRDIAVDMKALSTGTSTSVSDINRAGTNFQTGILQNVELSPNYKLSRLETMIFPMTGFFKELGVAGILGGDAFAQSVITFDAREKIMVINYPYRPAGLKITEGVQMFPGKEDHSIVDVDFGGVARRVLFDTGASDLLLLSSSDYEVLKDQVRNTKVAEAIGVNMVGISGVGQPVEIDKVVVDEMNFLDKKFVNVGSITINMGMSIVGVDILQYGKVVIDYMRNRFYFFPYDEAIVDAGGAPKTWNVGILPVKGHFEVTTVWDSLKDELAFGDEVVNINGKNLADVAQSQLEVDAILDAIQEDTAYIIVLKEGKEKKVEIKRF